MVKTKDSLGPLSELSHVRSGKVFVYMVVLETDMDASFLTHFYFLWIDQRPLKDVEGVFALESLDFGIPKLILHVGNHTLH